VQLGDARIIDDLIAKFREEMTAGMRRRSSIRAAEQSLRDVGVLLRQRIWDPLVPQLDDVATLYIVPDGALSLIPFAALPVGDREYLLDAKPTLHYLTSDRDLVPAAEPATAGRGLLALGGATFDEAETMQSARAAAAASSASAPYRGVTSPCESLQDFKFESLPASRREASAISTLWGTFGARSGPDAQAFLFGRAANERTLKTMAPGRRVLHLATHGFFLSADCTLSMTGSASGTRSVGGLVVAKKVKRPAPNAAAAKPAAVNPASRENPLLRSGLALAGANRRAAVRPDEDDGILTAEEVASLNLEGVEWAVLSACDTGLGEIKAGEGVFGLRRAFQIAGARTVIMSLWSVEDRSTMEWMRALYEGRLRRGLNTADAVRDASVAVLRDRRARGQSTHPFFWAGFVASGDWR
jgi:CHAT domain-containing protein